MDEINPDYYKRGKVECLDAIAAACEGMTGYQAFLKAQVIKYIWRWPFKHAGAVDLKKARFYLDKLIEMEDDK